MTGLILYVNHEETLTRLAKGEQDKINQLFNHINKSINNMELAISQLLDKATSAQGSVNSILNILNENKTIEGHTAQERKGLINLFAKMKTDIDKTVEGLTSRKEAEAKKNYFHQAAKKGINPFSGQQYNQNPFT